MSVDLRVNRICAISGHMHRLEDRRMRRGASGTPACACLPNDAYAQRWRLYATDSYLSTATAPGCLSLFFMVALWKFPSDYSVLHQRQFSLEEIS